MKLKIDVLYFEDCPNHLPTLERINEILREEGCEVEVTEVLVQNARTAQNVKFLGSPTVALDSLNAKVGKKSSNDIRSEGENNAVP